MTTNAAGKFQWDLPAGFPAPKEPAENPMTAAKVELGRHLFYDTRLSVNGTQSCASCHDQAKAFTDGKARAIGATGEVHPRGSMSIVNIAYTPVLTWANPNMKQLERQALVPMFGEHPVELGLSGKENDVLAKLKAEARYQMLFPEVFGNAAEPFTIENVTKAIAAFERTLISGDSLYDHYLNGDKRAITLSAKRGEALFYSERLECFHCHGGFNFSQTTDHVGKTFVEIEFHNTGLYNLDAKGTFPKDNTGTFEFTNREEDMGRFRAPTLRNITVTAPYMHDGSIATLEEVIEHYAAGGRTIRGGEYKGVGSDNPYKSAFVKGFRLTAREKLDLLAFLQSLTDKKFLADPRFSNPWVLENAGAKLSLKAIGNPAGTGGISPNFTRTPDGGTLLSWLEPAGKAGYALRFAIRQSGAWTAVRTITTRRNFMKHPAELPVVTMLSENNFVALWTQGKGESDEGEDAYGCGSRDGGRTWSMPARVHRDDSTAEHGLISMTPAGADAAIIVWLDGGNGKTAELKQARLGADGSVSGEMSLDDDVCECCPTSILRLAGGADEMLLAYRDHAPGDIRDISFLRFRAGRWSVPQSLHNDGWRINGCPTNSVQLAAEGKRIAAAWFTAVNEQGKVNLAFSNNAGESFGAPIPVNESAALGRASVVLLPDKSAVVAWAEKGANASRVLVRRVTAEGMLGAPIVVATGTKAFPRLERAEDRVMIIWSDAASVRTMTISVVP